MTAVTFDTLAYANKLKKAGLDSTIAETQASATAEIFKELSRNQLATKEDIRIVRDDIHQVEMKMYAFIAKSVSFTVILLGSIQTLLHFM